MEPPLRETIPLQPAKVIKKSVGATLGVLVLCGFASVFVYLFAVSELEDVPEILRALRPYLIGAWIAFVVALLLWNPVYQYLYYRRYFYDIDEKTITIRKGVIAQKEITLPFSKITDVYVDQDLLDVAFKLRDVHISTPTEQSGAFAHIDGVTREGSVKLRRMILDGIDREAH
jgi:uncharacterized membrane protein YdbT with pleckstrin-like domain